MYLISAYFDDTANRILQGYIDKIAAATGNTFMTQNHVPPHMTISSIEARKAEILVGPFESLQERIREGEIQFVSVGQLLPYVMYVTPVLNEYLQDLSKTIYEEIKDIPETQVSKYYQPMSWLPHVTLGKTLEKEQMRKAFEAMQESFVPFKARVTEIGLAKVNPHEDLSRFKLQ